MTPKEFRNKHNLSQRTMAQLLGITQAQYSRIESGDRGPSPDIYWRFDVVTGKQVKLQDFPALQETYQGVMREAPELRERMRQAIKGAA